MTLTSRCRAPSATRSGHARYRDADPAPRRRSRRLLVIAVAGASACLLAACSSSSRPASAPSRPTTTTTTPHTTAPHTTTTTTAPPTTTTAPPTTTTVPAVTTCTTAHLRVALGAGNGAAGSSYYPIVFTNVGATPCTLYGYPGVSAVTGANGSQIGAAASRTSATTAPATVTLAANGTASALLRIVAALNYPTATCHPATAAGLRVYPPGDVTAAFVAEPDLQVCASASVEVLSVGAVQAGSSPLGA